MSREGGSGRAGARGREALVELSASLAGGASDGLEPDLRRAADEAGPVAVEEAILQAHLFLGFPTTLAALAAWRDLEGGGADPDERSAGQGAAGTARGEEVCRRVYGSAYPGLRRNVRRLHPDLDEWMVRHGYGEVLGRDGLDLATRELCIVATLAADGAPRAPLRSHLRGALRLGAAVAAVERALEAGLRRAGDPEDRRAARTVWRRVREGRSGAPPDGA